jgi:hypothetical protein
MKADKTKGMALAYIDARDVMRRLDEVMGADWQCEYVPMPNDTCCCRIGLKIDGEWRWRSNGAINLSDSQKPEAKEMAEKGSYSDAFKRAAVLWGVGTYLYDLGATWVTVEPRGQSYVIPAGELSRLAGILRRGSPVTALTPPTAPARETMVEAVDPVAAVDPRLKPAPARTPMTTARDSDAVRRLILAALAMCANREQALEFSRANGQQSANWSLMLPVDQRLVLKAVKDKFAEITFEEQARAKASAVNAGEAA